VRNESFAVLRKHNVAHVHLSSMSMPMDLIHTADFLYLRFHGLQGGFAHDYTSEDSNRGRATVELRSVMASKSSPISTMTPTRALPAMPGHFAK
jgi:uncharacterized protein YecE (DUF72 family)